MKIRQGFAVAVLLLLPSNYAAAQLPASQLWQSLPERGSYTQALLHMKTLPTLEKYPRWSDRPTHLLARWGGENKQSFEILIDFKTRPYRYIKRTP